MTTSKICRILAAGIAAALLVLTQLLYDPISSAKHALIVSNASSRLPEARAKWESFGITDYTF